MPFNIRTPRPEPVPRTLDDAYRRYVGGPLDEPNWPAYEYAVDKIVRGVVETNGHLPSCRPGKFPLGLDDVYSAVENGRNVVKCRHCQGVIGRDMPVMPDATEIVPR